MTMVRPCRLITRQRSHMGLTDARTFISTVPIGDPTAIQVVGTQLDHHLVSRKDADVVLAHLSRDSRENGVAAVELDPEHGAGKGLDDLAFDLDLLFLCRHILSVSDVVRALGEAGARRKIIVAEPLQPS